MSCPERKQQMLFVDDKSMKLVSNETEIQITCTGGKCMTILTLKFKILQLTLFQHASSMFNWVWVNMSAMLAYRRIVKL